MLENVYYVYEILNSENNSVIYVGKGKNQRYKIHEYYASLTNDRLKELKSKFNFKLLNKIRKIKSNGFELKYVFVQKNMSEEDAYILENKLTNKYGLDNICNLKHGGNEGAYFSEETKKKMKEISNSPERLQKLKDPLRCKKISESKKGTSRSEETKQKLRNNLIGKTFEQRFGKEKSKEIIQKIVSKTKGQKRNDDFKKSHSEKFSGAGNPMYGKKHTDEFKQQRRKCFLINNPGKNKSKETIEKIKKSKIGCAGKPHTEEHKKYMSDLMKEVWRKRKCQKIES